MSADPWRYAPDSGGGPTLTRSIRITETRGDAMRPHIEPDTTPSVELIAEILEPLNANWARRIREAQGVTIREVHTGADAYAETMWPEWDHVESLWTTIHYEYGTPARPTALTLLQVTRRHSGDEGMVTVEQAVVHGQLLPAIIHALTLTMAADALPMKASTYAA